MLEELHLSELLCTRLCHDLTGPIGAVNNGAEFLREEGFNMQGEAVDLIVSSAFSAVTRLQFYRNAYGKARDGGEASLADKKKLVIDFFKDTKITIDWPDSHTDAAGVSISMKMSRLILNLLIIASGVLIRGGKIAVRISQSTGGAKSISITAAGAGIKWDPELQNVLFGEVALADLTPKNIQVYLTRSLAKDLGAALDCQANDESWAMHITQHIQ